jgi:DNA topoisomerase IA
MVDFTSSNTHTPTDDSDKHNSSPSRTKTPVELYQMIRSTFIAIGSPFAPYQEMYAEFEANHSGMTARVVSRDIHDAVTLMKISNSTSLLQSLQDSVEKLTNLAPFIFPLAKGKKNEFLEGET